MTSAKKKIIYILGSGRSGTTLLDAILGNQGGILSCGELNRYADHDGVPPLGSEATQKFWSKIKQDMLLKNQTDSISWYSNLVNNYEYHTGFLLSLLYKNKKKYKIYSRFIVNLYDSIFQSVGEKYIVDSSKHPGRLYHINNNNLDVKVIYIVRKYSDVISSFQKKNIEQPFKNRFAATIYYFAINYLCKFTLYLCRKRIRFVKVKFEDLINNPNLVFSQISDNLDIDLKELMNKENFSVGNLFDGNRIRLQNNLKITKID